MPADTAPDLSHDLRSFVRVCEDLLQLSVREQRALGDDNKFHSDEFSETRKDLLVRLNHVLISIKNQRKVLNKENPTQRMRFKEVRPLLDVLQPMIVKILQLDRENQQALLRRGLLPARNISIFAPQPPNFVTKLYSRHTS